MAKPTQEHKWLTEQFEENRAHLRSVAYRMLGSLSEAEDAIQEAWLRLSRANTGDIENPGGWLTTVVSRVCLDMLRSRKSRREEALNPQISEPPTRSEAGGNPETEILLADSVGLAMLVVLNSLAPAERVAFVLHDVFAISFEEIAPIVGRTPVATRQLASRARRRVQGKNTERDTDITRQGEVVNAFLAAARTGKFEALLTMLDPDVVFHADRAAVQAGGPEEVHGASAVARLFSGRAQAATSVLVDGNVGVIVAPRGHLFLALVPTIVDGKIARLEVVGDPERLKLLEISLLPPVA
jgi:RNA polymerase sigma factor (sigma-70 family)